MRIHILLSILLASAVALAADPSGGKGDDKNEMQIARAKPKDGLPWPAPDAAEVEKLKTELREQLPTEFTISQVGPWVIATDLDAAGAKQFTERTIRVYAAKIQQQLFTKTPRSEPAKIYLFRDDKSYTIWNKKLFGGDPGTPYGYYSRAKKSLVMNIGTGGGTLLHEMAHAMAEADFDNIPSWLNEGIGSLFEASNMRADGKVIGIVNWRLRGLQADLKNGQATGIAELMKMDSEEFYGERSGSNYATARYLMHWLQEQGKLESLYARIRDKTDASPADSLKAVFDNKKTVDEIERSVFGWVKTLRF